MRVGLDLTPAAVGHTGVVRYALELHDRLIEHPDVDVAALSAGRGMRPVPGRRLALPLRVLGPVWRRTGRPRVEDVVGPVDVVHSMDGIPWPSRAPLVVSLQDVLPATHPALYSDRARAEHDAKLEVLRRSTPVVVVSTGAVATEVMQILDLPPERIVVAPPGPSLSVSAASLGPRAGEGGPPAEVLVVGVITPRKGLDLLAAAIARLGPSAPAVVVAGPDGYRAAEVRAEVARLDAHDRIRFVGPVDDADLARRYAQATLVVHPSRAEGFGLVCVEAMAAGAPLVAVDIPAVAEVIGGAAPLVPDDASALAGAIDRLLAEPDERRAIADRGRVRAAEFSWTTMAEQVVAAYRLATAR